MTSRTVEIRRIWRTIRLHARHMDRRIPFWWNDPAAQRVIEEESNDIVARCWQQIIRQREGR